MSLLLLIGGILLFIGLVVAHEWGHFIAARRNGVEVEEFGIFFPPRLWRKKMKSGFDFTINALPLGGFVRLKGENDSNTAPGSFGAASLSVKLKIMLAGIFMNLVVAFVLLTILAVIGMPKLIDDQFTVGSDTKIVERTVLVGYVEPGSPAESGGLQPTDRLRYVYPAACFEGAENCATTQFIESAEDLRPATKQFAGEKVKIGYERKGEPATAEVQLRSNHEVEESLKSNDPNNHKGYLGIAPSELALQRSTWSAPIVAAGLMKQFSELTYKGIGGALANLFRGNTSEASKQVAGPVGIFVILRDGSSLGSEFILMIIAIISLTLAIINVLPIPALDGGRLFVTLLFRALKKPLHRHTEELIHGAGFALLMLLFVVITVVDVKRFF